VRGYKCRDGRRATQKSKSDRNGETAGVSQPPALRALCPSSERELEEGGLPSSEKKGKSTGVRSQANKASTMSGFDARREH